MTESVEVPPNQRVKLSLMGTGQASAKGWSRWAINLKREGLSYLKYMASDAFLILIMSMQPNQ